MNDYERAEADALEDAKIEDRAETDRLTLPAILLWVDKALGARSRPTQTEQNINYRRDMIAIGDGRKLP